MFVGSGLDVKRGYTNRNLTIEGFQMRGLLLDKILQFIDAGNLCISGGSVNRAFLALLTELEDLVGNLIIGFFVIGLI